MEIKFPFIIGIVNAESSDGADTLEINYNDNSINEYSYDEISSFIQTPGNSVIFEGNNINRLDLYNDYLKDLKVPIFFDDNEFSDVNQDFTGNDGDELINEEDGSKSITVPTNTTLVAIYNANGKLTVLQNEEPAVSKAVAASSQLSADDSSDIQESYLDDFKSDMDQLFAPKLTRASSVGDIIYSVRKQFSVNGSYTALGSTVNYVAGKAVTDYIFYANSTGDHFYVLADSQISPAGVADSNNAAFTVGYKSNIRTNSSTNSLISWSPNTSSLNLGSNSSYTVGANVSGTGIEISLSYTWEGNGSTTLESVGSKTSGLTTSYYSRVGSSLTGYGLASEEFSVGHGALIKASNHVLSFSSSHQFGNQTIYSGTTTWYNSSTTNLSYSF